MARDFLRIGIDARAIYKTVDGVGRYSLNLIKGLASIDHTNLYFIFRHKEAKGKIAQAPNFHEIIVDFRHLSVRTLFYLPLLIEKFDLDVFHSLFFVCPIWRTRNVVLTVHDLMALTFPGFFGGRNYLMEKAAYLYHRVFVPLSIRKAKRVIAVSQSTKKGLVDELHIAPDKISVIYEAVDDCFKKAYTENELEAFRGRKGLPRDYVLYVGNMKPYKNISLILSALEILKDREQIRHRLVIAGKKDRFFPSVREEVRDRSLLDDVIFLDYIADDELPLLFKNASLFLFPSLSEGFGLPALEAMSLGVPTIVSDASCLPEVVGDGALIVSCDDAENLAQTISRVLGDANLRRRLSDRGIKRSMAFSWEKAAYETLAIYNICGR